MKNTTIMPSLFIGHGSPMNLIENNEFTQTMKRLGESYKPQAVLVVSAHWLDKESVFQNSKEQKIIYDFYGFPQKLYDITYLAKGWSPELMQSVRDLEIENSSVIDSHGIDHGTWAVLFHMFPKADVPVLQLSISKGLALHEYFQIGQKLGELRKYGVLVLGSGNIVHNLHKIDWDMSAPAKSWAIEFDQKVEQYLKTKDYDKILTIDQDEKEIFQLSHPTPEHFIPLLYAMGANESFGRAESVCTFFQNATISMRSVVFS